ncbi:MAG: pyrroloquinoline quinone precursor peptide PqqA [Burkholderiales bacterium]|nr:pyrroloquinoline quinone precursor peptide PqqA [Burkholderia cenocepacia]MCD8516917.1 pyrroloquinoline quinone precursor peptide PqqA [Burkholderiaceae bacterium]MCD8565625.1 pyrroloquinoline quinone precursor peptide PqqA [Burkholderiaceae bacterium]MCE2745506.1 pyrroloquinoline quinone precursor peptide PqqA [Burkholderiales bacterium]
MRFGFEITMYIANR